MSRKIEWTDALLEDRRQRNREACARYRRKHHAKTRAANAAWYKANPEKARKYAKDYYNRHTERALAGYKCSKYKMTREQFAALMKTQRECGICKSPFSDSLRPHIDHDHATGLVRGLLCQDCNIGLGRFMDSADRLNGAIAYLKLDREIFRAIESRVA